MRAGKGLAIWALRDREIALVRQGRVGSRAQLSCAGGQITEGMEEVDFRHEVLNSCTLFTVGPFLANSIASREGAIRETFVPHVSHELPSTT